MVKLSNKETWLLISVLERVKNVFSRLQLVIKESFENRRQIHTLAKKELQKKYKGSLLGISWAFFKPLLFISIYWFAISFGFRTGGDLGEIPFIAWLATGIAPWFFISDTLVYGANSIRSTSYLVTKMKFPLSIIPIYRIVSMWYVHIMFLVIVFIITILSGVMPTLYLIQLPYFILCSLLFMVVLTWITSTLVVISKDFEQFIRSISTVMFWLVPVLWNIDLMSEPLKKIISLNPMVYLISGYRQTFLGEGWFWENTSYTIYFWVVLALLAWFGSYIHTKLRSQFADIL